MYALQRRPGFTIVELLIVIVVIAILAAISIVAYTGIQNRAADTAVQSDLRNIATKVQEVHALTGKYPSTGSSGTVGGNITEFTVSASKSAYTVTSHNMYYCAITEGEDAEFALAARSISGKVFAYYDGSFQPYSAAFTLSSVICPALGIPTSSADYQFSNGYAHNSGSWRSWVQ